jgi:hypothetical protein
MLQTSTPFSKSADELLNILNDWNARGITQNLTNDILALQNDSQQPEPVVEIVFFGTPGETVLTLVKNWLGEKQEFSFPDLAAGKDGEAIIDGQTMKINCRFLPHRLAGIRRAGSTMPTWLVAVLCATDSEQLPDFEAQIRQLAESYTAIVFVNTNQALSWSTELTKNISETCLAVKTISLIENEANIEKTIVSDFGNQQMMWLKNNTCLTGLEAVYKTILLIIEQEERSLRGKKAVNQQKLFALQAAEKNDLQELPVKIKSLISLQLGNLEKGVISRFDNFFKPKTGEYYLLVSKIAATIAELKQTQKAKTVELEIPEEIGEEFVSRSYDSIHRHAIEDLKSIQATFNMIEQEIEKICVQNDMPSPSLNFASLSDAELVSILDSVVYIDKPFSAEMPKKGAYEYFMAVRKYQMLFFMMASAFGLSFVRNVMMFTIPATLVLLGFGIYSVMITVEKERKEKTEKELKKAQESLFGEAKRIATEISRQWGRQFSEHLRNQGILITEETENYIKVFYTKRKTGLDEEKKNLQRMLQGIDQSERTLELVKRNAASWQRTLARNRNEIKTSFLKSK